MVAGFDQGFRFQGQCLEVGVAEQVPFVQGVQEDFAVFFAQVFCYKRLADCVPGAFYPVTLVKEQVLERFPGQLKAERKRLHQAAALQVGVVRLAAGGAELGQGMAEVFEALLPADLVGIAHEPGCS